MQTVHPRRATRWPARRQLDQLASHHDPPGRRPSAVRAGHTRGRLTGSNGHSRALDARAPATPSGLMRPPAAPPIFRAGAGSEQLAQPVGSHIGGTQDRGKGSWPHLVMQGNDHSPRTPAQLAVASPGTDDVKPSFSRARTTRAPETIGSRLGLTQKPDFDRGNDWLRRIRRRLIVEVQLQCLAQVGQRLVDGPALAGDLNVEAASHIPVAVCTDDRGCRAELGAWRSSGC